eukprot:TRINITY_DN5034_c0_g1_i1.p1 TRINITY_DN5034_c0_g1~~TRINITY_DN5034_c0_g1_i1.p1  ORF type:complete len:191 (-),score=24.96 TRINITY_DN5034_c0_g1_i1:170-742(-)
MKVAIVHPDLGIGGAERLIVDAALGLQSRGHDLEIFTSHHDEAHCFQETKNGSLKVTVWGDFLPRSFFGRFQILFAILRNIYLSIRLVLLHRHYDVIISDQISVSIPILKLTHAKILFYCHFPDQLLSPRNSLLKKIYRWPFDTLEEITTGKDFRKTNQYSACFVPLYPKVRIIDSQCASPSIPRSPRQA